MDAPPSSNKVLYGDLFQGHRRYAWPAVILSLIWVAFPTLTFAYSHPSPVRAAVVGVAVAVFCAFHLWVMLHAGARSLWAILAMVAIACALTVLDRADWAALFVFCAVAAGFRLPRPYCWYVIAACAPLAAGTTLVAGGNAATAVTMGVTAPAVGFMILVVARLFRANAELREAREQLAVVAVAGERLRFARDLHDLLGHSLSVIALKAELAERLLATKPEEAGRALGDVKEVARSALAEVRQAVSGYREPTLETELAGARFALAAAGIKLVVVEKGSSLSPNLDSLFAWTVREGITNVVRHSGARNCRVVIERLSGSARIEIADDGPGGDPNGEGHGLAGLRERAEWLQGRIEAGPLENGGFRLVVTVPVPEAHT